MFTLSLCSHPGCTHPAISFISKEGEITDAPYFCIKHIPNLEEYTQTVFNYIKTHKKIVGLNASGLNFNNVDLTDKRFYGCNFQHCTFSNIQSEFFRARMSIFDFSIFTSVSSDLSLSVITSSPFVPIVIS